VLAILIQLFVAAFSSFLVVGLVTMYSPGAAAGAVTIDVGVTGNASPSLAPVVDDGPRHAVRFDDRQAAMQAFRRGQVDAVLDATRYPDGHVFVRATAPDGEFRTTIVVVQLKQALTSYERLERQQLSTRLTHKPIHVPGDVPSSTYFGFTYAVLVPMLAFLPVFISGSIAADSLTEEIDRGTLELLRTTPLSLPEILDGKALTMVALAPAQTGLWLALLSLNGVTVARPLLILVVVAALGTVVVAAAAFVALAVGERRDAQLLYSFGVLALFAAATLLPENPANAVAKLAVGSATTGTWALVAASVGLAVVAYASVREVVGRMTPAG